MCVTKYKERLGLVGTFYRGSEQSSEFLRFVLTGRRIFTVRDRASRVCTSVYVEVPKNPLDWKIFRPGPGPLDVGRTYVEPEDRPMSMSATKRCLKGNHGDERQPLHEG